MLVSTYSLSHLSDSVLLRDSAALVAKDRATTAALLAHLAEIDTRKLYLPAGFPSLYAYCVEKLRMSEDVAYKWIQAARGTQRPGPLHRPGRRPAPSRSGLSVSAPSHSRECRRAARGGRVQDQVRNRAASRAALPTNGANVADAGHPGVTERAACPSASRVRRPRVGRSRPTCPGAG